MFRRVRHADGSKGVVLGDDMGLGKTVQIIALFSALLKKTGTTFGVGVQRRSWFSCLVQNP